MRNLFLSVLIALFSFSFMVQNVDAKRFGGGASFGASRSVSSFSRSATSNTARAFPGAAAAAAKPASTASKWLGPLAGLAAGGLLASLFMGHGLGGGIFSWILLAGVAFFAWRFISNRARPATEPDVQNNSYYQNQNQNQFTQNPPANSYPSAYPTQETQPANFDEVGFLRQVKGLFIRLQAAYDAKNLADIREFTAPQVSAEIQLQFQERGDAVNQTEVVTLEAELLDITVEENQTVTTVLFTGLVREEPGAPPVAIKEMWHFNKTETNPNWIVTGIQQA